MKPLHCKVHVAPFPNRCAEAARQCVPSSVSTSDLLVLMMNVDGLRKTLISQFCLNFLCKALQNVVELGISKASPKKNMAAKGIMACICILMTCVLCTIMAIIPKKSWHWDRVGLNSEPNPLLKCLISFLSETSEEDFVV